MKKSKKDLNNLYKKDTNGLFDGGFKSGEFSTKLEKQEKRKRSTREYLDAFSEFLEEPLDDSDEELVVEVDLEC